MVLRDKDTHVPIPLNAQVSTKTGVSGLVKAWRTPTPSEPKGLVYLERDDAPGWWAVTPERINAEFTQETQP